MPAKLRVLTVSPENFFPGAKLHIKSPSEDPPRASCRILVSFESRYGIRPWHVDG
jgi:hypothetical protein